MRFIVHLAPGTRHELGSRIVGSCRSLLMYTINIAIMFHAHVSRARPSHPEPSWQVGAAGLASGPSPTARPHCRSLAPRTRAHGSNGEDFTYNRAMKIMGLTAILLGGLAGASLVL